MQKLESAETQKLFNASKMQLRMRMQSLEIVVLKPAALHMRIKKQATEQVKSKLELFGSRTFREFATTQNSSYGA